MRNRPKPNSINKAAITWCKKNSECYNENHGQHVPDRLAESPCAVCKPVAESIRSFAKKVVGIIDVHIESARDWENKEAAIALVDLSNQIKIIAGVKN